MSFDFDKFRLFMQAQYAVTEDVIKEESEKIKLSDILEQIDFNIDKYDQDFREGDSLRLQLKKQYLFNYEVYLCNAYLTLKGIKDVELARFEGKEVQDCYLNLVDQIHKAQEEREGSYCVPF